MTRASHTFTDPIPATREDELRIMAERIVDGDLACIPEVEWEFYTVTDWRDAAEGALDSEDYSDLETMLTREQLYQGWMALSDREQDEWVEFENYCDARNFDRVRLPVDASDTARYPNFAKAAADLAAMPAAERERLDAEWRAR